MKFFDKIKDYFSLNDEEPDDEQDFEDIPEISTKKEPKILNIHTSQRMRIIISKPSSYYEVQKICDELKSRRPVITNLNAAKPEEAKRILDFLAGAVYALDGNMQKVANNVFIVAPSNVDIDGVVDINDDLKDIIN